MAERRILLVRLDGLGDALACVPALEALRQVYPDAMFGALCSPKNAELFSRVRMGRVHVLPDDDDERRVAEELRRASYTDALVATEEPIGYRLARVSGAARRAGFWHRFEKPLKSLWQWMQLTDREYRPAAWVEQPEHEVSALHRLAVRLGAKGPAPTDVSGLRAWLAVGDTTVRADTGDRVLAVQIVPKWLASGWDARAVAMLLSAMLGASPFRRCVLLAAVGDAGLARAVMEHASPSVVDSGAIRLEPPASLHAWLGSIARAAALVTPDTGAAHAAGMLGVPVVDIFETARFEQLSRQWRPWAAPSRCLARPPYARGDAAAFGALIGSALCDLAGHPVNER